MRYITALMIILSITACCANCQTETRSAPQNAALWNLPLPDPILKSNISLEQALAYRRSMRQFTTEMLSIEEITQLAWAGQGITEPESGLRTAPSAGAIHPLALYFVVPGGMYLYNPNTHAMEKNFDVDIRNRLSIAALNEPIIANAPCIIIIAGSRIKVAEKYRVNAEKFLWLEAGHTAQNILLQAVTLGLDAVPIGTFNTRLVKNLCHLPSKLEPIYIIPVGKSIDGSPFERTAATPQPQAEPEKTEPKKALFIIPGKRFNDEQIFNSKRVLDRAGVETTIAGIELGIITGASKGRVKVTVLLNEIVVDDYDAIIFVSGRKIKDYFKNRLVRNIVLEAVNKGKVVAAINDATRILIDAGVLRGLRATGPTKSRLTKAGAIYRDASVERDDKIVTANRSDAATLFGMAILDAITGREEESEENENEDEEQLGPYDTRRKRYR